MQLDHQTSPCKQEGLQAAALIHQARDMEANKEAALTGNLTFTFLWIGEHEVRPLGCCRALLKSMGHSGHCKNPEHSAI